MKFLYVAQPRNVLVISHAGFRRPCIVIPVSTCKSTVCLSVYFIFFSKNMLLQSKAALSVKRTIQRTFTENDTVI